MTRKQARLFAIIATAVTATAFIGMTLHSHTRFDDLTHAENITPEVLRGKQVWHDYNCVNCHTLFGEGAYYAPDLTKITDHRGIPYLTAFMKDPSQFYSEERHRRVMPDMGLSDQEIDDVLVFLQWIADIDNQGWPPRPILVSGETIPGTNIGKPAIPVSASDGPVAKGEALFSSTPPGCFACHSVAKGVSMAGPSLAGIALTAESVLNSDDYTGEATTVGEYIRESIVNPSAYVVPGQMYSSGGQSFMPANYELDLTEQEVDQLVEYLLTLK
ncbi:c-type cytochrome [Hydrocarboniclastica marina]|uniref:Cytochrome c n=1 Tax=Hydrocarboniclastica marina TaxID=2259620 RepID=A0A4P7XGE5_9ALTE|nr:cytochrome c [Hydrocarboniclastica marina]MAL99319.1 cytochrome C [Alteromonadaceae bacterium]QCF26061.1 cytochrome c [Hydrocarboniclastica marina]